MIHSLYIVLVKNPRWYSGQRIKRTCKRNPKLAPGEVCVKLEISTLNNLFDPPVIPVTVNADNIQHAIKAEATS